MKTNLFLERGDYLLIPEFALIQVVDFLDRRLWGFFENEDEDVIKVAFSTSFQVI